MTGNTDTGAHEYLVQSNWIMAGLPLAGPPAMPRPGMPRHGAPAAVPTWRRDIGKPHRRHGPQTEAFLTVAGGRCKRLYAGAGTGAPRQSQTMNPPGRARLRGPFRTRARPRPHNDNGAGLWPGARAARAGLRAIVDRGFLDVLERHRARRHIAQSAQAARTNRFGVARQAGCNVLIIPVTALPTKPRPRPRHTQRPLSAASQGAGLKRSARKSSIVRSISGICLRDT